MATCPDCGNPAGLGARRRGGRCRACASVFDHRQAEALASYRAVLDRLGEGDFAITSGDRLRQLEAAIADPAAVAAERERPWARTYERIGAEDGLTPNTSRDLDRLEALLPMPEGFEAGDEHLVTRFQLAVVRSDLPLPEVEDTTLRVKEGDAIHFESEAALMEYIDDYRTDRSGQLVRIKRWVAADSGVLAVTREGTIFLGEIVHREFGFDQIIEMGALEGAVHLQVHGYPDGLRFKLAGSSEVLVAIIERLRRESHESFRETTTRLYRTWRRWR